MTSVQGPGRVEAPRENGKGFNSEVMAVMAKLQASRRAKEEEAERLRQEEAARLKAQAEEEELRKQMMRLAAEEQERERAAEERRLHEEEEKFHAWEDKLRTERAEEIDLIAKAAAAEKAELKAALAKQNLPSELLPLLLSPPRAANWDARVGAAQKLMAAGAAQKAAAADRAEAAAKRAAMDLAAKQAAAEAAAKRAAEEAAAKAAAEEDMKAKLRERGLPADLITYMSTSQDGDWETRVVEAWRAREEKAGRDPYPDEWTEKDARRLDGLRELDAHSFVKFNKKDILQLEDKQRRLCNGKIPFNVHYICLLEKFPERG